MLDAVASVNGVLPLLSVAVVPAPFAWMLAIITSPDDMVSPCVMDTLPLPASVETVAIREIAIIPINNQPVACTSLTHDAR